jgi:D-inositol-3-phosphate glycosyltransferase
VAQPDELTIYLPDGGITPPLNPYGRLVANAGVYRALARHGGYRRLHFQCRRPAPDRLCEELLWGEGEPPDAAPTGAPEVTSGSPLSTASAVRSGILLSGQPYLTEPAWIRRHAGADDAYSIVGTVFAFSFPAPRELSLHSLLAPLHEWDALVCSSPTLRDTVDRTVTDWEDHLRERLCPGPGSLRLPRPQLPVIPFGVDAEAWRRKRATRARAR